MFKKNNNKMNLKTPKQRKKIKLKYFIYLIIIYFSFAYTFYYSMQKAIKSITKHL